jgi:cold shock CspA family protein
MSLEIFVMPLWLFKAGCFKSLAEGDTVEFEMTQDPKGPKAVNVRKA